MSPLSVDSDRRRRKTSRRARYGEESRRAVLRWLYAASNERVSKAELLPSGWECESRASVRARDACVFHSPNAEKPRFRFIGAIFQKPNEKERRIREEGRRRGERGVGRGAGESVEEEKKFAANGVSLMNAFFVSGKQRRPGPILPGSCAVR